MKRIEADLLLGLTGLIWGFGFVAQKDAAEDIAPFTFIACKFLISALFVLPFAMREGRRQTVVATVRKNSNLYWQIAALCCAFFGAVTVQQYAMFFTTVTNAAFLTGSYIVLVPFIGFAFYRHAISSGIVFTGCLSLAGVWLLTGVHLRHLLTDFNRGDAFMLLCALFFALQVTIMGRVVSMLSRPYALSFIQYISTGIIALGLAVAYETIDPHALLHAWISILYSGIASGGIAYTLQAVAQEHSPASDSSIIMGSSEVLFGALGGAWWLHESMSMSGYIGCALILASMILVEAIPFLRLQRQRRHSS